MLEVGKLEVAPDPEAFGVRATLNAVLCTVVCMRMPWPGFGQAKGSGARSTFRWPVSDLLSSLAVLDLPRTAAVLTGNLVRSVFCKAKLLLENAVFDQESIAGARSSKSSALLSAQDPFADH